MRLTASISSHRRHCSGLTLMETLLAGAIGALMLASLGAFTIYTARSFVAAGNYADLDQASRNSLDVMTRDIRESRGLTAFATNKLTLSSATTNTLIYLYNPSTSTLTRQE